MMKNWVLGTLMLLTADSTWGQLRDLGAPVAISIDISPISNQNKLSIQRAGETKESILLPFLYLDQIIFSYETETAQSIEIKLHDLEGRLLCTEYKLPGQMIKWPAIELVAGLYYLSVYNDNQRTIKKLVKL